MENQLFTKKNLIILVIIILVIVILIWIFAPKMMSSKENEYMSYQNYPMMEMNPNEKNDSNQNYMGMQYENFEGNHETDYDDYHNEYMDKTGALKDYYNEKEGIEGVAQETMSSIPSNYYFLDDGANGEMSIQHNLCSKSCCSPQYPPSFKMKQDPYVCANKGKYVGSSMYCNNAYQDAGCLCMTKKQRK